jgi:hypothetical protein
VRWTGKGTEAGTIQCDACGRDMPIAQVVPESRHVGGQSLDVVYWYCRAGFGHRTNEAREQAAASYGRGR